MKRALCLLLMVLTLTASMSMASADGETVLIPRYVKRMTSRLPACEPLPDVRLKDQLENRVLTKIISMRDPDATLYAAWADEPEFHPIELQGGKAFLEMENPSDFDFYTVKGPWTGHYAASGVCNKAQKKEENTDYFDLGQADATGYVTYCLHSNGTWYVGEVGEFYPAGDIAGCIAVYNQHGELVHYWLGYRMDEKTIYAIAYTPKNQPYYGFYKSVDEWGNTKTAYSSSRRIWIEPFTGHETTHASLNWKLPEVYSFTNPPRRSK